MVLNFAEVRKSGILNISEFLVVLIETAYLFTNLSTLEHTQSCTYILKQQVESIALA